MSKIGDSTKTYGSSTLFEMGMNLSDSATDNTILDSSDTELHQILENLEKTKDVERQTNAQIDKFKRQNLLLHQHNRDSDSESSISQDDIDKLQQRIKENEEEQERLRNQTFPSLPPLPSISVTTSTFASKKSLFESQVTEGNLSSSMSGTLNSSVEGVGSPIKTDISSRVAELEKQLKLEREFRITVCNSLLSYSADEDSSRKLVSIMNSPRVSDDAIEHIRYTIEEIGKEANVSQLSQTGKYDELQNDIDELSKGCHSLADSVLQILADEKAPRASEIAANPGIVKKLSERVNYKIVEFYRKYEEISNEIKRYRQNQITDNSLKTINEVKKLMEEIRIKTNENTRMLMNY